MSELKSTNPQLHHEVGGNGPALVILHGLFGNADNFRTVALHLQRHYTVYRIDLPAHGLSPSLPELSFHSMADAILTHLHSAGLTQYALLGHSLGGKVAMAMAGREPQGLKLDSLEINKLVVVDIAPRLYPPHHIKILEALMGLDLQSLKRRQDADKLLRASVPDAGVRAFLLKGLYETSSKQFAWRFDLKTLYRDYDNLREPPQYTRKAAMPTLFIKGSNSDYLQSTDELAIRARFAMPSFKEIGGTGHWPHAEKPALFTRLVQQFLEKD